MIKKVILLFLTLGHLLISQSIQNNKKAINNNKENENYKDNNILEKQNFSSENFFSRKKNLDRELSIISKELKENLDDKQCNINSEMNFLKTFQKNENQRKNIFDKYCSNVSKTNYYNPTNSINNSNILNEITNNKKLNSLERKKNETISNKKIIFSQNKNIETNEHLQKNSGYSENFTNKILHTKNNNSINIGRNSNDIKNIFSPKIYNQTNNNFILKKIDSADLHLNKNKIEKKFEKDLLNDCEKIENKLHNKEELNKLKEYNEDFRMKFSDLNIKTNLDKFNFIHKTKEENKNSNNLISNRDFIIGIDNKSTKKINEISSNLPDLKLENEDLHKKNYSSKKLLKIKNNSNNFERNNQNYSKLNEIAYQQKESDINNLNSLNFENDYFQNIDISPEKDPQKKLIFVKTSEAIKLNKLKDLSFAYDYNNSSYKNFNNIENNFNSNDDIIMSNNLYNRKSNEEEINEITFNCINKVNYIKDNDSTTFENNKIKNIDFLENKIEKIKENNDNQILIDIPFKNYDESDYKIDIETSKIFSEINKLVESTKPEYKRNTKKNNTEDILFKEQEEFLKKNLNKISSEESNKNFLKIDENFSDLRTNNFYKFNNKNNISNTNTDHTKRIPNSNKNSTNSKNNFEEQPPSLKVEDISNIMKRVIENNKKEAAAKSRDFLKNYPQNYLNLGKTQQRFFISSAQGTGTERPSTDYMKTRPKFENINFLEINLFDQLAWRRHEDTWEHFKNDENKNKIFSTGEQENYILPPNEDEVLISSYYKIYNITGKILLDDNTTHPREEINRWKNSYKKAVMRWHPDKLNYFVESLNIKDENKKNNIIKKAGVVIYNMNNQLKNIVEVLRKIITKKETKIF